jgi:hypothetical protein
MKSIDKACAYGYSGPVVELYLQNGNKISAIIRRSWQVDEFVKVVNERKLPKRFVSDGGYTSCHFVGIKRA